MSLVLDVVLWGLGLLALAYVVMPVVIKFTQSHRAHYTYLPVRPEDLGPEVAAFIRHTVHALRAEGYNAVASFRVVEGVPGVTAFAVLFVEPLASNRAQAAFTIGHGGPVTLRTPTLTLGTKFEDGTSLAVSNFADAGVFPPDPSSNLLTVPKLNDIGLLCEIHRRRRAALAPAGVPPVLPPAGHEITAQADEDAGELARVAAAGYYTLNPTGEQYLPTWKGAYLMTWKLMFPIGMIRRARKRRRARRELRKLGFPDSVIP